MLLGLTLEGCSLLPLPVTLAGLDLLTRQMEQK